MRTTGVKTCAQTFFAESQGQNLVSWKAQGYSYDCEDRSRDWHFDSTVIATIAEAEDFAAKLAAAIAEAKAENAARESKIIAARAKACGELHMEANGDFEVKAP